MLDFDPAERELHSRLGEPDAAQHPSLQLLLAHGQEVLPPEIESRVQNHLQACALCSGLLQDFASLPEVPLSPAQEQRIAAGMPASSPGEPASPRHRLLPVLSAIAAMIVLSAGLFLLYSRGRSTQPAQTIAGQHPPPSSTSIAQLEIPLNPLPPPADNTLALQTRGARTQEPSIEALIPAFDAYRSSDYGKAEARFAGLFATYPGSEIVPLYLGVSRLYLGKNQPAYDVLVLAQHNASPASLATAQWYAAIAAQRLHRPEARPLLTSICETPSSRYAAESCRIAPTLP